VLESRRAMETDEVLEVHGHRREVAHLGVAGIEVLMLRSEADEEHALGLPVVADPVDDAEALALDDEDALFPMAVAAGVRVRRDLREEAARAPGAESVLRSDEEGRAGVVARLDPFELARGKPL